MKGFGWCQRRHAQLLIMNSVERRLEWQKLLNKHTQEPCRYCDNDTVCHEWENLIAGYNSAQDIDYDDIPDHIARQER